MLSYIVPTALVKRTNSIEIATKVKKIENKVLAVRFPHLNDQLKKVYFHFSDLSRKCSHLKTDLITLLCSSCYPV